jgi:subtilisin
MAAVRQQWPAVQGTGVTVAVLDTGVDLSHPELGPGVASGYNALDGGGAYTDNNGHGTHMAGVIAAALNSLGAIGAAPQSGLAAVKVLDYTGAGYASDLINGLQWVKSRGIRLANLSLGFTADTPPATGHAAARERRGHPGGRRRQPLPHQALAGRRRR